MKPGSRGRLLIVLLAVLLLAARARRVLPFIVDDAFISLRFADRLVEGKGLTWTDGERVEGYTNLLWVLCAAALHAVGVDLVLAVRILGFAGVAAAVGAVVRAHPPSARCGPLPAVMGALGIALTGPAAVWSVGGMEQPLLAALLAWAMVLCYPLLDDPARKPSRIWVPGTFLALACLTRPDGVLFAAAACLGLAIVAAPRRAALRAATMLGAPSALACLAQTAFRLWYYGDRLPNTAYVKLGLTPDRLVEGLAYLGRGSVPLAGLLVPAAAGMVAGYRDPTYRRRALFLALPLAVWCVYVASIGGDIFPAWRHLLVVVVLLALLAAQGVEWIRGRRAASGPGVAGAVAALLVVLLVQQTRDPENRRARSEMWEWNSEVIGRVLRTAFAERAPLVAVDAAGSLPYFSRLPSLDMLGLCDRHIAHRRPPWFGRRQLGHELGEGAYVLARRPDLVIFCGPAGHDTPCYVSGFQMAADPRFRIEHTLVTVEGREPHLFRARIWARKEYGRIGVERSPDSVVVPGFLLGAGAGIVARLGSEGRLVAALPAGGVTVYRGLTFSPGRWLGRATTDGGPLTIRVHRALTGEVLAEGTAEVPFRIDLPVALDIEVEAPGTTPVEIVRLEFERR